jgi:hypothetical protein
MSEKYAGIERLLGLPQGSTAQSEDNLRPVLVDGVKAKTKELVNKTKQMDVLDEMSASDLVKSGFDLEELEQDKIRIKTEAFEVYDISRSLLNRFRDQIDQSVNPNDRMWASGAKLIDSVTGSIDKLTNMILKFKQEEEMKGLTLMGDDESTSKTMSPKDWIAFVKEARDDDTILDSLPDVPSTTDEDVIEIIEQDFK